MTAYIINQLVHLIGVLLMMAIGWYFGTRAERRHLARLDQQERHFGHMVVSSERLFVPATDKNGQLVVGSVVIAQDYFKHMVARVLSLFGKNLSVFEQLLERSRREAVLRLKCEAHLAGYNYVFGVRLQSTVISGGVETTAYGTAMSISNTPPPLPTQTNKPST